MIINNQSIALHRTKTRQVNFTDDVSRNFGKPAFCYVQGVSGIKINGIDDLVIEIQQ